MPTENGPMRPRDTRPIASLSIDVDNKWSYMKTHGDAGWQSHPSYLDVLMPHVFEILARLDMKITVFVVGQDAALTGNRRALAMIREAGHETGNHSFHHEPWLHRYTPEKIEAELTRAHEAIAEATGLKPCGFRGPGYSVSEEVLNTVRALGYEFDASTFPSSLGPLARAYYFRTAKLTKAEREERKELFGGFTEATRPLKPYLWDLASGPLLEIPVTTMPWFRVPFHFSYLLYLSGRSLFLARQYFRASLGMCRVAGVQPSLLLHPLDFLGADDVAGLEFFPGMGMKGREKRAHMTAFLEDYHKFFRVVPMSEHARRIKLTARLSMVEPRFGTSTEVAESQVAS